MEFFEAAAAVVIPLMKKKVDILHPGDLSDLNVYASIWCSIENFWLAATAEGYGCNVRIPRGNEEQIARQVLGFPEEYLIPCFIGIGRPALLQSRLRYILHDSSYPVPVKASDVSFSREGAFLIPRAVKDHHLQCRKMIEKPECRRRILHGIIKMHLVIILQLKAEITVLYEAVTPVLIQTIKTDMLQSMLIKPRA